MVLANYLHRQLSELIRVQRDMGKIDSVMHFIA